MSNRRNYDNGSSPRRTRWTRDFGLTILGAALSGGAHGCGGHSCTGKGCPQTGVDVVFSRALDSAKMYEVNVVADGSASTCPVTLQSTDACASTAIWTASEPTVTIAGQRLPPGGFAGIRVLGHPSSVTVTLSEDAHILATAQFDSVGYMGVAINGPGCGACRIASLSMNVP
jgi:hypothetical protein